MLRISKLTDYGTLIVTHMATAPERVISAAELADTDPRRSAGPAATPGTPR
jgi:DNA-binding IscR family transcriptional regulator